MAISKVVYKSSSSATPVTWMDATSATADASDIIAPKTAMLADGVMTTGTGSSGVSNWTLITSTEITANTTNTSATAAGTIDLSSYWSSFSSGDILWIMIRDKAGKRNGYFYGSDKFFTFIPGIVRPSNANPPGYIYNYDNSAYDLSGSGNYGLYPYSINNNYILTINVRYNSTYSRTINGTYTVKIYKLTPPTGVTPYD